MQWRLPELNFTLWKGIVKLYASDPLTHVYLLYDMVYELEHSDFYFMTSGNNIVGYLLIWRGPRVVGIHIWGEAYNLVTHIPYSSKAIVVLHDRGLLEPVARFLEPKGRVEIREHFDMVVDEKNFRPYLPDRAARLDPGDKYHVEQFTELVKLSGWSIGGELATSLLAKRRYYGVFVEGKLVSMACTFLRMPEVWSIGNVYTHPGYRGRGYAKITTSAITRDALASGAKALLHVAVDNYPAIKVYRALGYSTVSKKTWVFFNPLS